jgi:hypothetical protein
MELDSECCEALIPSMNRFYRFIFKTEPVESIIENYNDIKNDPQLLQSTLINIYVNITLQDKKGVKRLYDIINKNSNNSIDKKKINKFIYTFLKIRHKQTYKLWSFCEMMDFDIEPDVDIKLTTKYTL